MVAAAAALIVALGGATASTAAGEAVVNAAPPNLTIAVTALSGPDGNFGLAVEPGAGERRRRAARLRRSDDHERERGHRRCRAVRGAFNAALTVNAGSGNDDVRAPGPLPAGLTGGDGNDVENGNFGDDTFHEDVFDAPNGSDTVRGGPGVPTRWTTAAGPPLKDTVATHRIILPIGGSLLVPDCEFVTRQAVDDSPPGRPVGSSVRLAGGGALVPFRCPRTSRPSCRGRLVLADAAHPHRPIGRAEYSLSRGGVASIDVPLSRAAVAALRRIPRAVVQTVERGQSRIGPRRTEFLLRVRLGAPAGSP